MESAATGTEPPTHFSQGILVLKTHFPSQPAGPYGLTRGDCYLTQLLPDLVAAQAICESMSSQQRW